MNAPPTIDGIEFEGVLGSGAYSVVYRGMHDNRPCAIKLPRRRVPWTQWIYREAVALARVRHPSLARVVEVGESNALPYLVMDLVEVPPPPRVFSEA